MEDGPSSIKSPVSDEHPGPPFNHRITGSFLGSFLDSKNPKYIVSRALISKHWDFVHTVEQVLVLLFVIKIARVLLYGIDSECTWVHFLRPQTVVLEMTIDIPLLFALGIGDPNTLNVGTLDDMIPFMVWFPSVRLGCGEEGRSIERVREHQRDVVPRLLGLCG
jgi:hypothetical protein